MVVNPILAFVGDYSVESVIDLLTSKIFHDIGNVSSLLNFLVEMNKDDPASFDFNELVEVNARMLVSLRVLLYLFLPKSGGSDALSDITKYLEYKGKEVQFNFDYTVLTEKRFVLMAHLLLLLSKLLIDPATIDVSATDAYIKFRAVSGVPISLKQLKVFDSLIHIPLKEINLSDDAKAHVYYIKELVNALSLSIETIPSEQEFVLSVRPVEA